MRLFIRNLLWICAFAVISAGFTACSNDETGPGKPSMLSIESVVATSWGSAEVTVLTENIDEYAWMVLPSDEATPSEAVIFMDGTVVTSPATTSKFQASGNMVGLTEYKIHIAAKVAGGAQMQDPFYGEVVSASFTTLDYTDEVTILRTTSEGAMISIKYPEIAAENVVKWGVCNMALHAYQMQADADFLYLNDNVYTQAIIRGDTVLNINNYDRWIRDDNGELIYDEWTGEASYYWEFIAPGEPLYLIMSEVSWGESYYDNWGEGYYSFPCDTEGYTWALRDYQWGFTDVAPNQDDYWYEGAWHKRIPFATTAPGPYDGKVSISATDLTTRGGAVVFTPDPDHLPTLYTMLVLSDSDYQNIVKDYLNGDESLMQWYVSSYVGMWISGTETISGADAQIPVVYSMEDLYLDIVPNGTYHAMAVAMDGEEAYDEELEEYYIEADPMKQSYTHITFQLPDYKNPAPTIEVTALESTSPWEVQVNVKCTSYASNPIVEACYAANSPSEWDMYIEYGDTNFGLISQNRYDMTFDEEELQQMNSEEGLLITFNTRENESVRVGIVGWNAEGRPSNPDEKGIVDVTSASEPAATPISSPYYESLVGEWTATAKVAVNQYNEETWEMEWIDGGECSTTITIGDCYVPESMTEDVYAIYEEAGLTRETADYYFAQFKEEAQKYSEKVRGLNRILCTGWGFDKHTPEDMIEWSDLATMTPWGLFTNPYYNAATTADLFYDFGPKWFLQVAEDGSLFIPVNINRVPAAGMWNQENYLCGLNLTTGEALYMPLSEEAMNDVTLWPNMPVEVSEDGNTITIKSIQYGETPFYPNLLYHSYGYMYSYNTVVVSEVVLTRNTTSETVNQKHLNVAAIKQHAAKANQNATMVKSANGAKFVKSNKPVTKSLTTIKAQPKAKKMEVKQLSPEERKAAFKLMLEKKQQRMRK